jgi:polyisoprenoid-binding protein YceI
MRILLLLFLSAQLLTAQKYKIEKSLVTFYSAAPVEDIKAVNTKASSFFDKSTGEVVFSIPINQFQFEKMLMQQHFNEKYMESEKYPRASFQGKIEGIKNDLSQQQVRAIGILTIHGVSNQIEVPGQLKFIGNKIEMNAVFIVKLEDYQIKIPAIMWKNIAEEIEVTVEFTYKTL